jgi:hypothetical protein
VPDGGEGKKERRGGKGGNGRGKEGEASGENRQDEQDRRRKEARREKKKGMYKKVESKKKGKKRGKAGKSEESSVREPEVSRSLGEGCKKERGVGGTSEKWEREELGHWEWKKEEYGPWECKKEECGEREREKEYVEYLGEKPPARETKEEERKREYVQRSPMEYVQRSSMEYEGDGRGEERKRVVEKPSARGNTKRLVKKKREYVKTLVEEWKEECNRVERGKESLEEKEREGETEGQWGPKGKESYEDVVSKKKA